MPRTKLAIHTITLRISGMSRALAALLALWAISASMPGRSEAAFITNGGFEAGNLTGWTNGQGTATNLYQTVTGATAHTGIYSAVLGNQGGSGVLSQMATGLTMGTSYDLTFWFQSDGATPNRLAVQIGAETLMDQSNLASFAFQQYTLTFTATGASELLQFVTRDDPGFLELDDVSIAPHAATVPEPSSLALCGIAGVAGLGMARKRLKRVA